MSITENPHIVGLVRKMVAFANQSPRLEFVSQQLMRLMARVAMLRAGTKSAANLKGIFEQWQRSSPALAEYRLTEIKGETAYAEIHSQCALRGSGDVAACHRMMEYDREVMRVVGGELVVLESQATPGRTFCTVAMRTAGATMTDFTPAHRRLPLLSSARGGDRVPR